MRKMILGAASALALASPAAAADLPATPYTEAPSYERHTYEYRRAPPVVIAEPAPLVSEAVVFIVAPPRVVVEEYPLYAAQRFYAAPHAYAYAGPVWVGGWGRRGHFHGHW